MLPVKLKTLQRRPDLGVRLETNTARSALVGLLALGLTLLGLIAPARAQTAAFDFQTLDAPTAAGTYANGLSRGNIVGYWRDADYVAHSFIYNVAAKTWTTLDDPEAGRRPNMGSFAKGIAGNNVVGYRETDKQEEVGFLYSLTTKKFTTIIHPASAQGSHLTGISADGNVTGHFRGEKFDTHGFVYNVATQAFVTLDHPAAKESGPADFKGTFVCGISGGKLVGYYRDGAGSYTGFVFDGSAYTPLNHPAAVAGSNSGTRVTGIAGGSIVGQFQDAAGWHGFLYDSAAKKFTTVDVPTAAPGTTQVTGIEGGVLVGFYDDAAARTHGFIATPNSAAGGAK